MKSGHSGDQCLVTDGMECNDIVECGGRYIHIHTE